MELFSLTLKNVLLTLLYIFPGWCLGKSKKASEDHLKTLSAVLIYVFSPCMIVSSFLELSFSWTEFGRMWLFFGVTFVLQIFFMLCAYALLRKKSGEAKYRLLICGSVMGNTGFFGLPVIRSILPDHPEAACYACMFCVSMNILVFTVGVFCLTGEKKYMSLRAAVLNPSVASLCIGMPLFMLGARNVIPTMIGDAVSLLGKMTAPMCMIILGIRLAKVDFRKLFARPIVYATCLCKLLLFPLFAFACICFLPLTIPFRTSIVILCSVPCASIIFNLAEMHQSEQELAANCVLVSTLLCFLTIPVLTLLL